MTSIIGAPFRGISGYFYPYTQEQFKKDLKEANNSFEIKKIKETLDKLSLEFILDELSFVLSQSLMVFCLSTIQDEDLPYIDLLLEKNIQKDHRNQDDQNYIMALVSSNLLRSQEMNLNVLEKLLKSEIDPNIPDKYGVLPLEVAANYDCVKFLLDIHLGRED